MLYCCYGNLLCHENNINVSTSDWAVLWYHDCSINRPRWIYQYSNMAPRLSGQTSIIGVFSLYLSLLGIEGQKPEKPQSHARILMYEHGPLMKSGYDPSKSTSWKVLETVVSHLKGQYLGLQWSAVQVYSFRASNFPFSLSRCTRAQTSHVATESKQNETMPCPGQPKVKCCLAMLLVLKLGKLEFKVSSLEDVLSISDLNPWQAKITNLHLFHTHEVSFQFAEVTFLF